jgi:oligopeptide transport system substrate-binding protein
LKNRQTLLFCTVCILLAAACIQAVTAAPDSIPGWKQRYTPTNQAWQQTEQHFVFNNGSEPETLDPHIMTGSPEIRLAGALYEGLTTLDPSTLEPRPGIADRWTISKDGKRVTFHIRPSATWSDGQPIVAADFVHSWQRALTPSTGGSYANLLFAIRGAEDYFHGKHSDFSTVGIHAPDATTLVVELTSPCTYFLELTAFPTYAPVRTDLISKHNLKWTSPEHLVVSGPFMLDEWKPRQHIKLVRNPHYWDASFVKLDRVTAMPLDDLNTAYQLFLKGELHWMESIPQARVDEIKRNPDYYVLPFFGTYYYRFNVTKPPFDNRLVRIALSLATDRREITRHVLRSGQIPVASYCPPVAGYEPVEGLPYDRDRARRTLAEAGYGSGGKAFPPIEILYNTSEAHKTVAEAIAAQWRRNLGITASARNVEWKIFLNDMRDLNYQVCRSSWIGDYGDPSTFFDCFRGGDGNNRTGWTHTVYDQLAHIVRQESNPAARHSMFRKMEEILVEGECPILPIYRYVNQGLLAENVGGWYGNIRDLHNMKYIWMED